MSHSKIPSQNCLEGHSRGRYGRQKRTNACPISRNTGIFSQLAVPIYYEAPSNLQFSKSSAIISLSEVETSENFLKVCKRYAR